MTKMTLSVATAALVGCVALIADVRVADATYSCGAGECYDPDSGFCRPIRDGGVFCTEPGGTCTTCDVMAGEVCQYDGCGGYACGDGITTEIPEPVLPPPDPVPPIDLPPECDIPPEEIHGSSTLQMTLGGRMPADEFCEALCWVESFSLGPVGTLFRGSLMELFGPCAGNLGAWLEISSTSSYTRRSDCTVSDHNEASAELRLEFCARLRTVDSYARINKDESYCIDCPNPPQQECTDLACRLTDVYGQGRVGYGNIWSKVDDGGPLGKITGEFGWVIRGGLGAGKAWTERGTCPDGVCEECTDDYVSLVAGITGWAEFTYTAAIANVIGGVDATAQGNYTFHNKSGPDCPDQSCTSWAADAKVCLWGGVAIGGGGILFGPGKVKVHCWTLWEDQNNNC